MTDIAYSLLMSFLHSLWQSGLLVLLYVMLRHSLVRHSSPLFYRNLLMLMLGIQVLASGITFSLYYALGSQPTAESYAWATWDQSLIRTTLQPLAPWLLLCYLLWVIVQTTQVALQWFRFRQSLAMGMLKPDIDLRLFTDAKANHLGIHRKVALWLSRNIDTPMTFGWFKPVVLLPVALVNQLSVQQTEALILHELAHIKVNDYLYNWLLSLAEILFFFNPFLLALCKRARLEREKHCDTTVLQFNYSALTYAEGLLIVARMQQNPMQLQPAAVSGKEQLLQRIRFFTRQDILLFSKSRLRIVATGIILSLTTLLLLVLSGPAIPLANPLAVSGVLYAPVFTTDGAETSPVINNNAPSNTVLFNTVTNTDKVIAKTAAEKKPVTLNRNTKETDTHPTLIFTNDLNSGGFEKVGFNGSDMIREVIIEEQIAGKKALQVYLVQLKDGQLRIAPQLIAESKKILIDTVLLRKDSLRLPVFSQQ